MMSGIRTIPRQYGYSKYLAGAALLIVVALAFLVRSCLSEAELEETRSAVRDIRAAAIAWQIDHGDQVCPNLKQLIGGKYLTSFTRMVDAWGQHYVVTCFQLTIGVTSSGPDRTTGTSDDIVAAPAPVRRISP
jgi:hypothetical protein